MATTFNVLFLGQLASIDPTEGNDTAENAGALVGMTFGAKGDPLSDDIYTFSKNRTTNAIYRMNNSGRNAYDTFNVNYNGTNYTLQLDATVTYNALITYSDGTTATITAVVFQDTNGYTFVAPEYSANADQAALEAKAIRSITLLSLENDTYSGMNESRETWNYVACFTKGTLIDTIDGPRAIETLKAGDLVWTLDDGYQPLRWIGSKQVVGIGDLAPVFFQAGALGVDRDIMVSPNHRMYLSGGAVALHTGSDDALAMAKHLVNGAEVRRVAKPLVSYVHMMFDRHQIVRANGILSESFHPGDYALDAVGAACREEILTLFPQLVSQPESYGSVARFAMKKHEVAAILRDVVVPSSWNRSEFDLAC
ncbi:Hint domain-containing protein [Donghicola sp. C2-DW-16]|uniref:Hint domain-containing protein n=1 Tax=Donghicola mangrovi TaxID=2729614 RepID=A0ABX2PHA3_9RHOB|nr:Hint domain-containing protein [Donghicola mangrovi]NVO28469.1 Hint domain-containing protein [Donghicola mangrovi]